MRAERARDLTSLGVAAPETQAGARNVTSTNARLRGVDGARVLMDARPSRGFFNGGGALRQAGTIRWHDRDSQSAVIYSDQQHPQIPRRCRRLSPQIGKSDIGQQPGMRSFAWCV